MNTDSLATSILEDWGFEVTALPTRSIEQSDFLVLADNLRFLVEEKTKQDNPEKVSLRQKKLASGEVYVESHPIVPNNRLSGVITKAVSQLDSSSDSEHDFRLIWFTALGMNAEIKFNQFVATLYGTTNIIEMHSSQLRPCYFFRNSEFFRHRETLDGAVVAAESGDSFELKLCLNPLSARYERLRGSTLARTFALGVEDPLDTEKNKMSFVVDSDIDRRNEAELLSYLQQKYQTQPLMKMDMGHLSVSTSI